MSDKKNDDAIDSMGLPVSKPNAPQGLPPAIFYTIFQAVLFSIGTAIAYCVYRFGDTKGYNLRMEPIILADYGWVYLGALVLTKGFVFHSILLGTSRKASRVGLPNQHVYKVYQPPGSTAPLGYVLMEDEGAVGRFNRAQRAYSQYLDSLGFAVLNFLLAAAVFPFPAFVLASIYAVARAANAAGYVSAVDSRGPGLLGAYICLATFEGANVLVAVRSLTNLLD
mmetsp:Transcript_32992/g.69417  ORF Transcript_32992/g.69417 Transcript_32992/m.69417 type:complete len:224 (-) Transcript_32992:615-1286(-)